MSYLAAFTVHSNCFQVVVKGLICAGKKIHELLLDAGDVGSNTLSNLRIAVNNIVKININQSIEESTKITFIV